MLLLLSWVFTLMLIIGNPKKDLIDNRVSIFNELMVSAYLYVMMTLSDYNEDLAQTSYYMNIALSTIVITSTGINLLKFIINTIMHIFKGIKRWHLHRQAKKYAINK